MKIIIFSPTSTKLTSNSLNDRPLGGADQALLRMCYALGKEHEVKAFIPVRKFEKMNGVIFQPFQDLFNQAEQCDLLIHYRKCYAIPNTVDYGKLVFYSQDDSDSPCFAGVPDDYFRLYDKIIVLSKYHKEQMIKKFVNIDDKIEIIGNAAEMRIKKVKNEPLTFIYASTPFRGLVVLAKMWKDIIKKYPTAKLHIFSSMEIYDGKIHDELYFNQLYDKLKKIKGIIYHGSTIQKEVLKCMGKANLLLYPNTFPETYCNVLMEARASETPFITSNKGALPETGGEAGIYIDGNPYTSSYQKEFLENLYWIIEHETFLNGLRFKCLPIRTWGDYARDILRVVNDVT